ncbi:MAG: bifunctional diaminohydroxyphosphoribosylaminopyrimidine deaminase/5-amino-6-(5-phosphoribosylamino)uracil reductase RibD [Candidatus Brocadiales bacterium]
MTEDERYMQKALELAQRGRGRVEPNPMVGALVVKDGTVLAEGWHECFGGPHAEIVALEKAGAGAKGATLYVTLEPCAHQGKTPPCVKKIIGSGIKKVVFPLIDPNPLTSGKGRQGLLEAGVGVTEGVLEGEARKLNAPFFKLMTTGMPYVIAKWAMSLDGKTATHTGDSRWVSSKESRGYVHRVRSQVDAVIVGINTVLRDNPLLTSRIPGGRNPRRIVLDSQARIPMDCKLLKSLEESEVIIATTPSAPGDRVEALRKAGCGVVLLEGDERGVDPVEFLKVLGQWKFTNVLLEGGGSLTASFFEKGLVDRVMVFISPKIIGGVEAKTPVGGRGVASVEESLKLKEIQITRFSEDVLIEGIIE